MVSDETTQLYWNVGRAIVPLLISVIKFYLNTELYGNSVQLGGARKGAKSLKKWYMFKKCCNFATLLE